MTIKFNPKQFQGKNRVYIPVSACSGILKLWNWDNTAKEYRTPNEGKVYDARRYELNTAGVKVRVKRYFTTLEEARLWQNHIDAPLPQTEKPETYQIVSKPTESGPTFAEVYAAFEKKKISILSPGSQLNYSKMIRLYFASVFAVPICDITPRFIDNWMDGLRDGIGRFSQSRNRASFRHELSVMRSVLRFYSEYYDDPNFRYPVKARHAEDARKSSHFI